MNTSRLVASRRTGRGTRILAVVSGLLAAVALAVPGAAAATDSPAGAAAPAARTAAAQLQDTVRGTGVAWGADASGDTLRIQVDPTVRGADLAAVQRVADRYGSAVRVERLDTPLTLRLSGGDAAYTSAYRCTVGVNVRKGTTDYFVTAGHCAGVGSTWYADAGRTTTVGPTVSVDFPGNDYALVAYTNGAVPRPGTIGSVDITGVQDPVVGLSVCMRGGTSGVHCGVILALNQSVSFPEGTITGLIRTNICSEPGDSGAPLYSGDKVIGILVGGSGNCASGGTSYFQPIREVLNAYGVSVY